MSNAKGHAETLVASHPGHRNAERHGAFSRMERPLEPHVQAMAEQILALPHTGDADIIGAIEIAKLLDLIDRIDADLAKRGLLNRQGDARRILELRARYSQRLAEWLDRFGLNPKARAEWTRTLAEGESLAQTIRRKVQEAEDAAP